jgi:hypothetical protein
MNKTLYMITLLLLLIFGCKSPVESSSIPTNYFPLQIGNKWYYNAFSQYPDSIDLIWEVVGQKEINGKQYFAIKESSSSIFFTDTIYFRFNRNTLLSKINNNPEQYVADFSLNLNDSASWRNDLKVVQKSGSIMKFETPFGPDYGYSITFKNGIGITNEIQNGIILNHKTLIKSELK